MDFFLAKEYQTQVNCVYVDNLPDPHKCLGFEWGLDAIKM